MHAQLHDWSDAFLNEAVRELAERIVREYEENPYNYADEDGISLREDVTFERYAEKLSEELGIADEVQFTDELWKRFDHGVFEDAREKIHDLVTDHTAYQRGILSYHGLSQKDFY